MTRYEMVVKSTADMQKKTKLTSSEDREILHLHFLCQISETLALMADMYAFDRRLYTNEVPAEEKKNNLRDMAKKMKEKQKTEGDSERIPDSEIPFASDD